MHHLPLEIFLFVFVLITKCYTILPIVLYWYHTWSLTLREGHRLRVFENRVLNKIFGPKREEVTGEGKRLHEQERQNLYSLPNIVRTGKLRRVRSSGHLARMGEKGRELVGET